MQIDSTAYWMMTIQSQPNANSCRRSNCHDYCSSKLIIIKLTKSITVSWNMASFTKWPQHLLRYSMLFRSQYFQQKGNQKIMSIHSRLLSAYCVRMLRLEKISVKQAESMLENTFPCYEIDTTRRFISRKDGLNSALTEKEKFVEMLFHGLKQCQFKQFNTAFQGLIAKDQIMQFDLFLINQLATNLTLLALLARNQHQIIISKILNEQTVSVIEPILAHSYLPNPLAFTEVAASIVPITPEGSKIHLVYQLYSNQLSEEALKHLPDESRRCVSRQALSLVVWIFHLQEFGTLLDSFQRVKEMRQFYEKNLNVFRLLKFVMPAQQLEVDELLILFEVITKLQSSEPKRNEAHELRRLRKEKKMIEDKVELQVGGNSFAAVERLNSMKMLFESSWCKQQIKKLIVSAADQQYLPLVYSNSQKQSMLELCLKINEYSLYQKIKKEAKFEEKHHSSILITFFDLLNSKSNLGQKHQLFAIKAFDLKYIHMFLHLTAKSKVTFPDLLEKEYAEGVCDLQKVLAGESNCGEQLLKSALFKSFVL